MKKHIPKPTHYEQLIRITAIVRGSTPRVGVKTPGNSPFDANIGMFPFKSIYSDPL